MHSFFKNILQRIKQARLNHILVQSLDNSEKVVWDMLLKIHKNAGFHHGVYQKEKTIHTSYSNEQESSNKYIYLLENEQVVYRGVLLKSFDVSFTNDILVLCSHLNSIINFGVIRPDVPNNYVEFTFKVDQVVYCVNPERLHIDTSRHIHVVEDLAPLFNELITSGDDPIFVFSTFMRQLETEKQDK
jgi:hypothetical protein